MATPNYVWDANTDQTFIYTYEVNSVGNANPGFAFPSPNGSSQFTANSSLSSISAKLFDHNVDSVSANLTTTISLTKDSYLSNTKIQTSNVFGPNASVIVFGYEQINNTNNIFATLYQRDEFYVTSNTVGSNTQLDFTTDERLFKTYQMNRLAENMDTDRYIEPKQRWVG